MRRKPPTFSTIDYQGSLNNDADYTIQISDLFNINNANAIVDANFRVKADKQNLTPFSAIYGNYFRNTDHALPSSIAGAWNELAVREGYGIINANAVIAGCTPPLPPAVAMVVIRDICVGNAGRWGCIDRQIFLDRNIPATICASENEILIRMRPDPVQSIPGTFDDFIRITGNGINRRLSKNIQRLNLNDIPRGTYTISSVRQYTGSSAAESVVSSTLQIVGNCRTGVDCPNDIAQEGGYLVWLNDTSEPCFRVFNNNTWFAITESGAFISRSRLITNGLDATQANCYGENDPRGAGTPTTCDNGSGKPAASSSLRGNVEYTECAYVAGWALDLNNAGAAPVVDIYVDGYYVGNATANLGDRPDLVTAFNNNPAYRYRKFQFNFPATAWYKSGQTKSVVVKFANSSTNLSTQNPSGYAINCSGSGAGACTGTNTGGGGTTTACNVGNFNGNVDVLNCSQISGWSFDFNDLNRTVKVNIFSDGQLITTVDANQNRGDLGTAFNNPAAIPHGFTYNVPNDACWKNNQNHFITVKPCGGTDILPSGSGNLNCPGSGSGNCGNPSPGGGGGTNCAGGNFGGFLDVAACGQIAGWSFDFDNINRTVQVDIFVDGQKITTVNANQSRSDLGTAFNNPAAIPHGYSYSVPNGVWWKNGQNHTVTARPCGGTQDLSNSPQIVNCSPGSRIAASEEIEKTIVAYPNPTGYKVKVGFNLIQDQKVLLNLYDLQGKNLQLTDYEGKLGYNEVEMDLQNYPAGTYLINLQISQKQRVFKVIKEN